MAWASTCTQGSGQTHACPEPCVHVLARAHACMCTDEHMRIGHTHACAGVACADVSVVLTMMMMSTMTTMLAGDEKEDAGDEDEDGDPLAAKYVS